MAIGKLADDELKRVAEEVVRQLTATRADGSSFTGDLAEKLSSQMKGQIMKDIYSNLGQGVWKLFWQGLTGAIIALAAIGAAKSGWLSSLLQSMTGGPK